MQTRHSNRELWLAFFAILGVTTAYLFIVIWFNEIPNASDFFGHTLGIFGFILMLMTETLYTLRKRSRSARWGQMASWLNFHIFTGLVGPYMVLLHTSWKFNGLAGVVTLLTLIVVASGFIGRYIYTSVPRSVDGAELEADAIEEAIHATDSELREWLATQDDDITRTLVRRLSSLPEPGESQLKILLGRTFSDWSYRLKWWYEKRHLTPAARAIANQLEHLLQRRRLLNSQIATLAMARRLLALWHAVHIPIGMALFTAAFIHIGAAIYYATLLR